MPRMPARVFAVLLAADAGRLTAPSSPSAAGQPRRVSGAVRYLTQISLIEREREPGSRRDVYRLRRRPRGTRRSSAARPLLERWEGALRDGVDAVGPDTPAGARLQDTRGLLRLPAGRAAGDCWRAGAQQRFSWNSHLAPCRTATFRRGGRMTELEQYLAEEIAEDHVDGIITRREAMRRLGLLGVGATTASAMIAAEAAGRGPAARTRRRPRPRARARRTAAASAWAPVAREPITFAGPERHADGGLGGPAARPRGGVLVIHENRGLTDHIRNVAGRFAASGYSRSRSTCSPRRAAPALPGRGRGRRRAARRSPAPTPERFDADMKAAVTELGKRVGRASRCSARSASASAAA